jgi:hypothetical protein
LQSSLASLDEMDPSEQFRGANRRIVVAKPVAAQDQEGMLRAARASHYPVREQTPLSQVKCDFPW